MAYGQNLFAPTESSRSLRRYYTEVMLDIIRRERAIAGDRFATLEETNRMMSDPFDYFFWIRDIFIVRTGREISYGVAFKVSEDALDDAIAMVEKDVAYETERAARVAQEAARVAQQAAKLEQVEQVDEPLPAGPGGAVGRMALWAAVNKALADRGLPEVLFGEICALWEVAQRVDHSERMRRFVERIERLGH